MVTWCLDHQVVKVKLQLSQSLVVNEALSISNFVYISQMMSSLLKRKFDNTQQSACTLVHTQTLAKCTHNLICRINTSNGIIVTRLQVLDEMAYTCMCVAMSYTMARRTNIPF